MRQESRSTPIAIALALLIITAGLLLTVLFVAQFSSTDDTNPSIDVANATSTIDSIVITDTKGGGTISEINLVEATTSTVYVEGQFTDLNDCTEVTTSGGRLFVSLRRDGIAADACDANDEIDPRNCYISSLTGIVGDQKCTTTCTEGSQSADYSCTFDLDYFADGTDTGSSPDYSSETWEALAAIKDAQSVFASDFASTTAEVNSLVSLLFLATELNYGSLDLGATSTNKILSLANRGNYQGTDMDISGTDLTCTVGTIDVGQQKFATSSESYEMLTYTHMNSPQSVDLNMAKQQTTSTEATSNTYWAVVIPSTAIGGSCQGSTLIQGTTG